MEVPRHAPQVVAIASAMKTLFMPSILPFSSTMPAFWETPMTVPMVSNMSMKRKVKSTTSMSSESISPHWNWQKMGATEGGTSTTRSKVVRAP